MQHALFALLLQTTWIVDDSGGPGVNFTDIPPAIAAAADGDILLVRAGNYSRFVLSGKGLRILGEGASSTVIANAGPLPGGSVVSNVPAGSLAYLDRMSFLAGPSGWPTFRIEGTTTRVVLADLTVSASDFYPTFPFSMAAVSVTGSEVQIHRCNLWGHVGCIQPGTCYAWPTRALWVEGGARVLVTASLLVGGPGHSGNGFTANPSQDGAPGAVIFATAAGVPSVWFADSVLRGGTGGSPFFATSLYPPGSGAPGLVVSGGTFARVSGNATSLVQGGDAGCSTGTGFTGLPGPGISTSGASTVDVHSVPVLGGNDCAGTPGPATSGTGITLNAPTLPVLRVSGNLTLSGSATVTFTNGPPGAPFWIAVSNSPGFQSAGPLFLGEIAIGLVTWFPFLGGNLSGAGDFSITIPLAAIGPGVIHFPVYLQGIALDPSGTYWRVSTGTVATVRP